MKSGGTSKSDLRDAVGKIRGNLLVVLFFSFFINLLMFVGPLYMLTVYDRVLTSRSEVTLVVITALAIGLLIIYSILEGVRSRILVRVSGRLDELLSSKVFRSAFRGTIIRPGQSYTQSIRDLDSLREFVSGSGVIAFCDAPWVPVFIGACFLLHPWLGVVSLVGAIVIFALALTNEFATRRILIDASGASVAANNSISSSIRNAESVHALGMSGAMHSRWEAAHRSVLVMQAKASDRAGAIMGAFKGTRMALQVAILGVGAFLVIEGQLTAGAMIAASILMGRALAPVEAAVGLWKQFVGARTAWSRVNEMLQAIPAEPDRMALPPPSGRLDLQGITVIPPGSGVPSVRGVSFSVEPGEVVAIIGPSGAGKSSIVRAMVGVWPLVQGKVRIDGSEIGHWNADALGSYIGYLSQDVELFTGTVAENISRFGATDPEKVLEAAMAAGAHSLIQQFPQGYDTVIAEAGRSLSGGQRQRIALARALYNKPSIIILDEPNSNLDTDGETALNEAIIWARAQKCAVVIVSHKTSLLSQVDKVAVIVGGQLRSFGPPTQILGAANVSPLRAPGSA